MRSKCITTILLIFLSLFTMSALANKIKQPYIWHGNIVTDPKQYPFIVSIEKNENKQAVDQHQCGGTIIAKDWVLTAGHCVKPENISDPNQLIVRYGTINFSTNLGELAKISKIFLHPNFAKIGQGSGFLIPTYDIALLKLAKPISIKPVRLPYPGLDKSTYAPGIIATVIGWGIYQEHNADDPIVSPELRQAKFPIMFDTAVKEAPGRGKGLYKNYYLPNIMMATDAINSQSVAGGDSGGPLLIKINNEYVEIGTISWNAEIYPYGLPGYPDVYTRLSKPVYMNWIYTTIMQNS